MGVTMQRPTAIKAVKAAKATESKEITYEQYLAEFTTEPPTMQPYEILEGVRYIMNSPILPHQMATGRIYIKMFVFGETTGIGASVISPFDIVIRRKPRLRTRQPDVLFISKAKFDAAGGENMTGPLEVAPELVVEVLSPSETPRTLKNKLEDFRSIGVLEAWIVSMEAETIQVQKLSAEGFETVATYAHGQVAKSVVFPDLQIPVAEIFPA